MARRTRVTTYYARQLGRLVKHPSERALAMGRTLSALSAADELPGPSDFEAYEKPMGQAWVRRVGSGNLWLWYRFNDDELMLLTVTTEPPLPLDDAPRSG